MSKTAPLTAEVRCACMWLRHHWLWECVWFCWGSLMAGAPRVLRKMGGFIIGRLGFPRANRFHWILAGYFQSVTRCYKAYYKALTTARTSWSFLVMCWRCKSCWWTSAGIILEVQELIYNSGCWSLHPLQTQYTRIYNYIYIIYNIYIQMFILIYIYIHTWHETCTICIYIYIVSCVL